MEFSKKNKITFLKVFFYSLVILFIVCTYHENRIIKRELNAQQQQKIQLLEESMDKLSDLQDKLTIITAQQTTANVTVTFYHPQSRGINSDNDPGNTALMLKPVPGRTVALSTSLVRKGWLGKKIYIEGYGIFYCEDRMAPGLEGNRIDICANSLKEAYRKGRVKNVFAATI